MVSGTKIYYGVGQIFEDGTIKDIEHLKFFEFYSEAEYYCAKQMADYGWTFAKSPYLAIFTYIDGKIIEADYVKFTKKDLNIPFNPKYINVR